MTASSDSLPFVVTHKMVLAIAIPMTLGMITVPIVGMVDMAVIGQLGKASLMGGIAIGALLISIVSTSFNFLRMGTTGLTAQAVGSGDEIAQRAVIYRALILAILLGLATILIGPLLLPWALKAMGATDAVNEAAQLYVTIRFWAMPAALSNYVIFGWLFGIGKSREGMVLLVLLNCLNIAATIWFVLGLGLGVDGAAWGTLLAEYIACLLGFALIGYHLRHDWRISWARLLNKEAFARFMALNRDIFIRSLVMLLAFSLFTSLSARQGETVLAANELLMHFFMLGGFFLDGIAIAAEQIAGRAIGARYRPAFDQAIRLTLIWGFGLGAALSAVLWAGGPWLIDLLTKAEDVRPVAYQFMIWAAITPIVATLAFQMDGVFVGATWSRDMRNMSLISSAVFAASVWVLMPLWGNHGLWAALLVFLASRGVGLFSLLPRRAEQSFTEFP